MTDIVKLKKRNGERWAQAKMTRQSEFGPVAKRLIAPTAKARYRTVEAKTGVPWFFVAVTHQREASQRWDRQLGQGDPLNKVSTRVPKGRGPFHGPQAWEDAAVDALVNCHPYAARNKDWSIGGLLTMLEQYNGLGYAAKGLPSPYVWSGTDQYARGKYVADHVYDPSVVDKQLGCAGLLLVMQSLDPTIALHGEVKAPAPLPVPVPTDTPRNATAGAVVATGSVAALVFSENLMTFAIIAGIGAALALVVYFVWPKRT